MKHEVAAAAGVRCFDHQAVLLADFHVLKVTTDSSWLSSRAQRFETVSSSGPMPASVIGCRQSSMARDEVGSRWSVPASSLLNPTSWAMTLPPCRPAT